MTAADWTPALADIAATREARRNGNLRGLLRQGISEGKTRARSAPAKSWPASGRRRDVNGTICPHCGAGIDQRCRLRTRDQVMPQPHSQRVAVWVQTVACCPTCQAAPGQVCRFDGMPLPGDTVHAARHAEAERTAA